MGIIDNYESREEHYPEFVSLFQNKILPIRLQFEPINQELLRSAPVPFPPKVDPKEVSYVKKTINIESKIFDFCKLYFESGHTIQNQPIIPIHTVFLI